MTRNVIPLLGLIFWTAYGLYYACLAWSQPERCLGQTGPGILSDGARLRLARFGLPILSLAVLALSLALPRPASPVSNRTGHGARRALFS